MVNLSNVKVLALAFGYWGKGDTIAEALQNARNPKHYVLYLVHEDTWVDAGGFINYPTDFPPREILVKSAPKRFKK